MEIQGSFDATQFDPTQVMPVHPVGKFLATISGTDIKPTKENNGGFLEVMFTTEAGSIPMRYNLWNQSQQATDIAHKQLSALCYATGVFKLDYANKAGALRGARCGIEVTKQPNSDYTQVAAVMDVNGNLPTKQPPTASQQFAPQSQPMASQTVAPVAANPWSKPTVAADPPGAASPPQGFQQQPNSAGTAAAPPWATR